MTCARLWRIVLFMDTNNSAAAILCRQRTGKGPQHPTQVVAAALHAVTGAAWASLCCWCLEKPANAARDAYRVHAAHGECDACPYVGRDCLVAAPVAQ